MKKALNNIARGGEFEYAGQRWIALKHEAGCTLCLAANVVKEAAFDESNSNDFSKSSIARWLNGAFLDNLIDTVGSGTAFVPTQINLIANDGLHGYGECSATIFLLTAEQYLAHSDVIKHVNEWWWLSTPYDTANEGFNPYARYVGCAGNLLRGRARYDYIGIRPACYIQSETLVDVDEQKDDLFDRLDVMVPDQIMRMETPAYKRVERNTYRPAGERYAHMPHEIKANDQYADWLRAHEIRHDSGRHAADEQRMLVAVSFMAGALLGSLMERGNR